MKPNAWSPTALGDFENCPFQYHEVKVLKKYPFVETKELVWGREVHKHFENFLLYGTPLPADLDTHREFLAAFKAQPGELAGEERIALDTNVLLRAVTGDERIDFADAQASRYRPRHLLTAHNDLSAGKNRLYAYVLNLTREWRADWGGVLMFQGDDGHVEHGWTPAFNALNLFTVPTRHAVSQVAVHAPRDRLSIVGWLRSNSPVGPQLPA